MSFRPTHLRVKVALAKERVAVTVKILLDSRFRGNDCIYNTEPADSTFRQ
ncbi:MAG: hypothetical protein OEU51_08455 [Gammaproteobacteria bacterium]|nr:hypothetical protein [Gammaproteobacteria bacterium]